MGEPKQLLSWQAKTLIEHAADTVLQTACRPVFVVLGHEADHVRAVLGDRTVECVDNVRWRHGMGTSLQTGVAAALAAVPALDAVLVTLCDQPHVRAADLQRLLDCFEQERPAIVASRYERTRGVPAVLGREALDEVARLAPDRGAKTLIERPDLSVATVDVPAAAHDIDTAADYASLEANEEERSDDPAEG